MKIKVNMLDGEIKEFPNVFRMEHWDDVFSVWEKTHNLAEPKITEIELIKIRSIGYNHFWNFKK